MTPDRLAALRARCECGGLNQYEQRELLEEIERLSTIDLFKVRGVWHVRHADGSEEDIDLAHGNLIEDRTGTCGQVIFEYLDEGISVTGRAA